MLTDGCFPGGSCGAAIGHIFPEPAEGGPIAAIRDGDMIEINIPGRMLRLFVSDEELQDKKKYVIFINPKRKEIFKIYRDKLNEISKIGG